MNLSVTCIHTIPLKAIRIFRSFSTRLCCTLTARIIIIIIYILIISYITLQTCSATDRLRQSLPLVWIHKKVLGFSLATRWKYSGCPSLRTLLPLSLWRTLVDSVFLFSKLSLPPPRFFKLDTIISARSCWSRWKFSLKQKGKKKRFKCLKRLN